MEIKFQFVGAAQSRLHCCKQLARRGVAILTGIAPREIRAGDDAALRRLAHMQLFGMHQPVEELLVGLRVDDQTGRRLDRQLDADGSGNIGRPDTGCDHHLFGWHQPMRCIDTGNPAIGLDKCGYRTGENARTLPFCVGQQRLGRCDRFGHAFFRDIDSEFRRLDEIGLDLRCAPGVDAFDAVTPGSVLSRVGFEPVGRQIPAQPAAPGERQAGQLVCQPLPFGHRTDAQPEIDFGIAPAGVDPGKGVWRGDAAGTTIGNHSHPRPGLGQVPGDGRPDNAGADDDDFFSAAHTGPLRMGSSDATVTIQAQVWSACRPETVDRLAMRC
ncbi:hypothetical protein X731_13425 [Mesorhizobium sp. L2C054A000]|nr:hypothetical protein X731_13425 [Mesorhizobium sp. L2C054A000]